MYKKLILATLALAIISPALAMQQAPAEEEDAVDVLQLAYDHEIHSTIANTWLSQNIKMARLKKLIAAGPSQEGLKSALDAAFARKFTDKNEETALFLINHGVSVHFDQYGEPYNYFPLWHAAANGWMKTCELLLEKGADINAIYDTPTETPPTPLAVAAYNGQDKIEELLLARGADIQTKDNWKWNTALHYAMLGAISGKNARKNPNWLAQAHAEGTRYKEVLNVLTNHGIDQSARNRNGNTAQDLLPHNFWN